MFVQTILANKADSDNNLASPILLSDCYPALYICIELLLNTETA